jgi:hypothetical protein
MVGIHLWPNRRFIKWTPGGVEVDGAVLVREPLPERVDLDLLPPGERGRRVLLLDTLDAQVGELEPML